jgi:hypothetical protein
MSRFLKIASIATMLCFVWGLAAPVSGRSREGSHPLILPIIRERPRCIYSAAIPGQIFIQCKNIPVFRCAVSGIN